MVYNPTIQSGVSFEQPVQQPSLLGAVGSIASGLFSGEGRVKPEKPTEDEAFQMALRNYRESKGAAFQFDRAAIVDFAFQQPRFHSQIMSWAESQGIKEGPFEVQQDVIAEWAKTPEGASVVLEAAKLPTREQREAHISNGFALSMNEQAEVTKVKRQTEVLSAQGTLETEQWKTLQPVSRDFTDRLVSTGLGPIITEVTNGNTVDIDPQTQAALGLRYKQVSLQNLPAVLMDARSFILKKHRDKYREQFGKDAIPPKDWEENVMFSVDALIEIGKSFDTPAERATQLQGVIEANVLKEYDKRGLNTLLYMLKTLPPETAQMVLSENLNLLGEGLVNPDTGQLFTTIEMKEAFDRMSTPDAESLADMAVKIINETKSPTAELFNLFIETQKRNKYDVVDEATFGVLVGSNVTLLKSQLDTNPEFRTRFEDWVYGDLAKTRSAITSQLPQDLQLVFQGGKWDIIAKPGARVSPAPANTDAIAGWGGMGAQEQFKSPEEYRKLFVDTLDKGMNLDTLNKKYASLGLLGEVGKQVQESLTMSGSGKVEKAVGGGPGGGATASQAPDSTSTTSRLLDKYEGGGDYDTLYQFSNREGGPFEGIKLTDMTVAQAIEFANPNGAYGQWVKGQIGRVATPMGRFQFVGSTLKGVVQRMGLDPNTTKFDMKTQNDIFVFHANEVLAGKEGASARNAMRATWEGLKNASDAELDQMIAEIKTGNVGFGPGSTSTGRFAGAGPLTLPNGQPVLGSEPEPRAIAPVPMETSGEGPQIASSEAGVSAPTSGLQGASEGSPTASTGQENGRGFAVDPEVQAFLDSLGEDEAALIFNSDAALQKAKQSGKVKAGDKVIVNGKVQEVS